MGWFNHQPVVGLILDWFYLPNIAPWGSEDVMCHLFSQRSTSGRYIYIYIYIFFFANRLGIYGLGLYTDSHSCAKNQRVYDRYFQWIPGSLFVVVKFLILLQNSPTLYGGFLKWWYPTTMGFPTKNDHFGVFWGYPYFWNPPYIHN